MSGRRAAVPMNDRLCRRCQAADPDITVRSEPLCKACFNRYVATKVVKRMESFRVRHSGPGSQQKLLLALSLGSSSTSLLHVLSQHLKGQMDRTGRSGYKLHVLHVDDEVSPETLSPSKEAFEHLSSRFSEHEFSFIASSNVLASDDLPSIVRRQPAQTEAADKNKTSIADVLAIATSATARADTRNILLRKIIVQFAKSNSCEAILWGHNTTRLAEQVLAETAKGRGFSLPWTVSDGESPLGLPSYFPLREVLAKEVEAYLSFIEPSLTPLISQERVKPAVSAKNTTIDDLMNQYFETVEKEYPSIVANVVRTAGKLKPPGLADIEHQCELCDMPLHANAPEKSRLCHGCIRNFSASDT